MWRYCQLRATTPYKWSRAASTLPDIGYVHVLRYR